MTEEDAMKVLRNFLLVGFVMAFTALPSLAQDDALAKRMNDVLSKGIEQGHWQVNSDEVNMWIKTKAADFVVVDVRPKGEAYQGGHIPGAIHIPYHQILTPANLAKLPKDKKIVLVCATGQLENLPVVPLRILGHDAYTMTFGYASWIKDFGGADQMKAIIEKAEAKNYPVEK
jgi:rhodanese-related sulfurtransferase